MDREHLCALCPSSISRRWRCCVPLLPSPSLFHGESKLAVTRHSVQNKPTSHLPTSGRAWLRESNLALGKSRRPLLNATGVHSSMLLTAAAGVHSSMLLTTAAGVHSSMLRPAAAGVRSSMLRNAAAGDVHCLESLSPKKIRRLLECIYI